MFSLFLKRSNIPCIRILSSASKVSKNKTWIVTQRVLNTGSFLSARKANLKMKFIDSIKDNSNDSKNLNKVEILDPNDVECEYYSLKEFESENYEVHSKKEVKPNLKDNDSAGIKKSNIKVKGNNNQESSASKSRTSKFINNPNLLSRMCTLLKSNKGRNKEQKFILEGKRLIYDAIAAGIEPEFIFFSRYSDVNKLNLSENVKLCKVDYQSLQIWSDVIHSQGVLGVFKMGKVKVKSSNRSIPLTIICDNIKDPGNLGAALRVSAGVGCQKLILTKGCVDVWESKVLRSACGAHFRIPIIGNQEWFEIEEKIPDSAQIFIADNALQGQTEGNINDHKNSGCFDESKSAENNLIGFTNLKTVDLPLHDYNSVNYAEKNLVLVIGGETQGVSNEALAFGKKRQGVRIAIPMENNVESLNSAVALGVLAYEIKRQFRHISVNSVQGSLDSNVEKKTSTIGQ